MQVASEKVDYKLKTVKGLLTIIDKNRLECIHSLNKKISVENAIKDGGSTAMQLFVRLLIL